MKHLIIPSMLLLAFAPFAHAQEGPTIGFDDAALDVMPPAAAAYADLLGGELTLEGDALRATLSIGALPEMLPGLAYVFLFSNGTEEYWAGAVTAPTLEYYYGTWISDQEGPSDVRETRGSYTAGAPGTIEIELPLAYLDGSTLLSSPRAATADIKGGAPPIGAGIEFIVMDSAQGSGEMRLPEDAEPAATTEGGEGADAEAAPQADADGTTPAADAAAGDARVFAPSALATIAALLGAFAIAWRRHG